MRLLHTHYYNCGGIALNILEIIAFNFRTPTCADSIFQCVCAVNQKLLQVLRLLRQFQAEAFQSVLQLVRVVEVQHLQTVCGKNDCTCLWQKKIINI